MAAAAPIHAILDDEEDGGGGDCEDGGDEDDSPEVCLIDNGRRFSGSGICFGSFCFVMSSLLKS